MGKSMDKGEGHGHGYLPVACARWRIANFAASPELDAQLRLLLVELVIVHALVMLRLDYRNAVLYGLSDAQLQKLQL